MKTRIATQFIVTVTADKHIPDLVDIVAGRLWSLDHVVDVSARTVIVDPPAELLDVPRTLDGMPHTAAAQVTAMPPQPHSPFGSNAFLVKKPEPTMTGYLQTADKPHSNGNGHAKDGHLVNMDAVEAIAREGLNKKVA